MKKKLATFFVAAVCSLMLVACGSKGTETSEEAKASDEAIIELGNYKGLTVEATKGSATDEEIESYATYYYNTKAADFDWNKKAEMGDTLVIDFVGKVDGVAFEGGTSDDYTIVLGSNTFFAGFEDAMVGMSVGDVWDLDLKFPDDYWSKDLAGKPCVFTVTCDSIVPPMSEDTVSALQDENFSNISELKTYVTGLIDSYYTQDYETDIVAKALEQIVAGSVFGELPEDKLNEKIAEINDNYASAAAQYGVDIDTYFSMYNTTAADLARILVQRDLVFAKIGELEGITFTDEEVDAYVQKSINDVDGSVTLEQLYEYDSREQYREYMILDEVQKFLVENTIVTEPQTSDEKTE